MADNRFTLWMDRNVGEYWWVRFWESTYENVMTPLGKTVWYLLLPIRMVWGFTVLAFSTAIVAAYILLPFAIVAGLVVLFLRLLT